jgi:hypothetical protein
VVLVSGVEVHLRLKEIVKTDVQPICRLFPCLSSQPVWLCHTWFNKFYMWWYAHFTITNLEHYQNGTTFSLIWNVVHIKSDKSPLPEPKKWCANYKKCNFEEFFFNSHSGGWSADWVHLAHRPLLAYCTFPRWLWSWRIWWNEDWQGKQKYSEKTCPSPTPSTTNPTSPDPGVNLDRRGGKPVTNRLIYGVA